MSGREPTFCVPHTLEEAVGELAAPDAMALGGGTSVALLLKHGLIEPGKLVWLAHVPALQGVAASRAGILRLGAATTLGQLARSDLVQAQAPSLARAASAVGNPRVRAVATVGGAIAHGDPRQDLPPVLLSLSARARLVGPGGEREVPLQDLLVGWMETALLEGELVADVLVPVDRGRRSAYVRFTPGSEDDYPTVGVAVSLDVDPDGVVSAATLALGGVGPRALPVPEATGLLVGRRPEGADLDQVAAVAETVAQPTSDRRGSASYKRAMVAVWTRRALERCLVPTRQNI